MDEGGEGGEFPLNMGSQDSADSPAKKNDFTAGFAAGGSSPSVVLPDHLQCTLPEPTKPHVETPAPAAAVPAQPPPPAVRTSLVSCENNIESEKRKHMPYVAESDVNNLCSRLVVSTHQVAQKYSNMPSEQIFIEQEKVALEIMADSLKKVIKSNEERNITSSAPNITRSSANQFTKKMTDSDMRSRLNLPKKQIAEEILPLLPPEIAAETSIPVTVLHHEGEQVTEFEVNLAMDKAALTRGWNKFRDRYEHQLTQLPTLKIVPSWNKGTNKLEMEISWG